MASEDIKAGGAYLEVTAKDDGLRATLKSADAFIEKWTRDVKKQMSSAAVKMGASFATVGASITAGFGLLKETAEKLKDSFVSAFEDMKTNGTDSQKQAAEELQTAWETLHGAWLSGLEEIIGIVSGSLSTGMEGVGGILQNLTTYLHENKNVLSDNLSVGTAWIQGFLSGLPQCWDLVKNIGIAFANLGIGIANLPGKMYDWLTSFEPIRDILNKIGSWFGMEALGEIKIPEIEKLDYVDSSAEKEKKQSHEAAKVRAEDHINEWRVDNGQLDRLGELASGSNLKNSELDEAQGYVDKLTEKYGELGITIDRATGSISGLEEAQKRVNEAQQNGRRADLQAMGLPTLQVDNGLFNPGSVAVTPPTSNSSNQAPKESNALKQAGDLVRDNELDQMSDEEREKAKAQEKYDNIYNARVEELRGEYGSRAEGMATEELVGAWEATQSEIKRIDEKYRSKEAEEKKKQQEDEQKKRDEEQKKREEEEEKYWQEMERQQEEYKAQQVEQLNKQIDSIEQAQSDSKKTYSSAGTFSAWDQIDANASLEKSIADNNKQQLTEQKKMVDYLRELVEMYEDSEDYDPSFTFA